MSRKKSIPGYHRMTKEQKIEKLFQNGITKKDIDKAYEDGKRDALRQASDCIMKACYASICMAAHEQLGFGKQRIVRFLRAVDDHICNTFTGEEAVQEVFDKIGILIDFKDPDGSVQDV